MSAQTIELAPFTPLVPTGFTGTLTSEQAATVTAEIRGALDHAQAYLRLAFAGKAHEALGYGKGQAGWDAYYADNFADVAMALPVEQRRLEVAKWNDAGASLGVTATALGVSKPTISEDRKHVGQPQNVVSLDGRRRDSVAASAAVVEAKAAAPKKRAVPLTVRIEAMVRAKGAAGWTSAEARKELRLHHGAVSAVFTALKEQRKTVLNGEKRDNYGVHVAPEFLIIDAEIVAD